MLPVRLGAPSFAVPCRSEPAMNQNTLLEAVCDVVTVFFRWSWKAEPLPNRLLTSCICWLLWLIVVVLSKSIFTG
ncbi:hypothetical protein D3C72_1992880 [compost metagenome]